MRYRGIELVIQVIGHVVERAQDGDALLLVFAEPYAKSEAAGNLMLAVRPHEVRVAASRKHVRLRVSPAGLEVVDIGVPRHGRADERRKHIRIGVVDTDDASEFTVIVPDQAEPQTIAACFASLHQRSAPQSKQNALLIPRGLEPVRPNDELEIGGSEVELLIGEARVQM